MTKKELKAKIKKDKARLKELRALAKQNALSVEETWEFTHLLNESTDRITKQTKILQKIAIAFVVATVLLEIVGLVMAVLTALK